MTDAPVLTAPRGSAKPLDTLYDVALLDLDGTVYLGGAAIAGAPEALHEAGQAGMRLAYVTNNANRTPAAIAELLTSMGVPATADDIVTSAQAAAHMLADRLPAGAPVLVIGGSGLRQAVRERGLRPVTTAADKPLAVVEGFSPTISYSLLAEGGLAVAAGALYVLSNADRTLPSSRGNQPGNGSLGQVIAYATGFSRWWPANQTRRCTTNPCSGPAPSTRWPSGTGWTPTSRARIGAASTACSC